MTAAEATPEATDSRPSLLAVFRVREFRALWLAEVLSVVGDQFARVALAVAVFERTNSAALTGLAYALTFVPALLGGTVLGGLGDRFRRRAVMIVADGVRAVVIAAAVIPGLPLPGLFAAVAVVALVNGPFKGAQQAILPDVLPGPLYVSGMAVRSISTQAAQLIGFAGGGALVTAFSPSWAFAADSLTFVVSAVVIGVCVTDRSTARAGMSAAGLWTTVTIGTALIWRDTRLRTLLALVLLAGFYIVPEALAAPYAAAIGASGLAVGAILASDPVGSIIGGFIWGQWMPNVLRERSMAWFGVAAGMPLIFCIAQPPLIWSMALFALSGACATAYTVQGVSIFVQNVPDERRAIASSLLSTGLIAVQGIGALAAGVLADAVGPPHAIAYAGIAGACTAVAIAVAWDRVRDNPAAIESLPTLPA